MINFKKYYDDQTEFNKEKYNLKDLNLQLGFNKYDTTIINLKHKDNVMYRGDYIYLGCFNKDTYNFIFGNVIHGYSKLVKSQFKKLLKIKDNNFKKLINKGSLILKSSDQLEDILAKSFYFSKAIFLVSSDNEHKAYFYLVLDLF
jgi:hypothetical protein